MAITALTTEAVEKGTYIITVAFTDEDGDAVIPNAATIIWTLTDKDGNIINSREDVAIASAASIEVVLSGNDLKILSTERKRLTVERRLHTYAEYDGDAGSDLPITGLCKFNILND